MIERRARISTTDKNFYKWRSIDLLRVRISTADDYEYRINGNECRFGDNVFMDAVTKAKMWLKLSNE